MKNLLLLLAALAQIAAIGWMIGKHEYTVRNGTPVKFVAQPVDPADPFRGRYVALRLDTDYATAKLFEYKAQTPLWAYLETDPDGYVKIVALSDKPATNKLCLRVKNWWRQWTPVDVEHAKGPPAYTYHCSFAFESYYMNENAAPEAEKRYNEATRANRDKPADETALRGNYLVVRILDGQGVAEQLYLEGQPVEQLLGEAK